jgi:hypothetical protein
MLTADMCVTFYAEVGYFSYLGHANQLAVPGLEVLSAV